MARPLRIEFPGAVYHVTSRGNDRADIFLTDADRLLFLDILGVVVEKQRWVCFAYCLMPNHYHVLVETPDANLSRGMRELNGLYTQRLNHRHKRVGHVFQGRYKGILVERESHLVELGRYVVLNPVRAGMVEEAVAYRWSSLRATLGLASPPPWLTVQSLLESFGSAERYLEFVREGVGAASPWAGLRGRVLGSEEFVRSVAPCVKEKARQKEFPRRERFAHRQPLADLLPARVIADRALRNQRIREACMELGYSYSEVGRFLGLHYGTVSRIATGKRGARGLRHKARPDPIVPLDTP
jgi:REP element-mobilizing transposase RayT